MQPGGRRQGVRHRKWVRTACVALLAYGLLRFLYGGVFTPARSITGDFYSAFPAPFTEAYNPVLLKDNIFGKSHVSLQGYWSYGPGFHVITLPLTLFSSYSLIDWLVLLALWCSIGAAFWLVGRRLLNLTGWVEWSFLALIWLNFTPLHASIGQRAIELPEMLLILWAFAYWEHQARGGIGIIIAATLKFLPVMFIPYLAWKRRWKGVGAAVLAAAIILASLSPILPWRLSNSVKEYRATTFGAGHTTTHANNQSLVNLIQRVFIEGEPEKLWLRVRNSEQVRKWAGWVNLAVLAMLAAYGILRIPSSRPGFLAQECGLLLLMMVMLINRNQTYYLALALPGISAAAVQLFREDASAGRKVSLRIWAAALAAAYLMMSPPVPMRVFDWLADAPLSTTLDSWKILGGPGLGGLLLLVVLVGVHARTVKRERAHAA